jgi:hypothetical protein
MFLFGGIWGMALSCVRRLRGSGRQREDDERFTRVGFAMDGQVGFLDDVQHMSVLRGNPAKDALDAP